MGNLKKGEQVIDSNIIRNIASISSKDVRITNSVQKRQLLLINKGRVFGGRLQLTRHCEDGID